MSNRVVKRVVGIAVVMMSASLTFVACGKAEDDQGNDEVSFATDIQPILNARCANCHKPPVDATRHGLDLTAGNAYAALVNVPSKLNDAVPRVKAGDTAGSMLWRKIAGEASRTGNVMPPTGALKASAPDDFAKLEKWIEQGAKNN